MTETIELDEGFIYGFGAFETIAIMDGRPLFLDEHLSRMRRTLEVFGLESRCVNRQDVELYLIGKNTAGTGRGVLKVMVSERNAVFTFRSNTYTEDDYRRGFELGINEVLRNESSPLVSLKTLSFAENVLEKRRAHTCGYDEWVHLNTRSELCECSTSNIFFVKKDKVFTPDVSCGLLPGIIRDWVIDNHSAQITRMKVEELHRCDEAFITNSLIGVMPVTRIGEIRFTSREKTLEIQSSYRQFCDTFTA